MKRFLAIALSLMVAVTFGFTWTGQASAKEKTDRVKEPIAKASQEYKEHEAIVMFKTNRSLSKDKAKSMLKGGDNGLDGVEIVKNWNFKEKSEGTGETGKASAQSASKRFANVALVRSDSLSTKELIKRLKKDRNILYAEPNYKIRALSLTNDTYSDLQWSMKQEAANVDYEWTTNGTTGSDEAIVAVVDTGVDYTHEDLAANIWENDNYPALKGEHGFDFSKADDDPMDENGHGTHCAGIIGAVGNNNLGISGVNQKVRIMALRILDEDGSGWNSEEIAAYNYISKALDLGEPVKAINNSWGGGEDSDIFAELIDIVGEKGAVSVFAAGNEGSDNDKYPQYPSDIETPYSVVVAATKEDNDIVSFSNYGESTVDVAAPGTDILSTVSYDCYNPTIYTEAEQTAVSKAYNSFDGTETWGIPDCDPASGQVTVPDHVTASAEVAPDGGFLDTAGLKLTFSGMKANEGAIVKIPYTLDSSAPEVAPKFSAMVRPSVPEKTDGAFLVMVDVPYDTEFNSIEDIENYTYEGYYISGDQDNWDHYIYDALQDESDLEDVATERAMVLAMYADVPGDYSLYIDDLGVSLETEAAKSQMKKYDFYSGTSMATPFITGALALKAEELAKTAGTSVADIDSLTLIPETVSLTKETPALPVIARGGFEFMAAPEYFGPRIGSITVGEEPGTIVIAGSGLNPPGGLKLNIQYSGNESGAGITPEIIEQSDNELIIRDEGWINNVIDCTAIGYNDKVAQKKEVYLVKGKEAYTTETDSSGIAGGASLATDGKYIYSFDSENKSLLAYDPAKPDESSTEIATIDPSDVFNTEEESSTANYDMLFSRDLACTGGKVYTVVEYGEGIEAYEEDDDWWFFSNSGKSIIASSSDDEDDEDYAACGVLYSSELRLISINTSNGTVTDLGALPESLEKTVDWSLAAYNGKLYFIGGYSLTKGNKGLTTDVQVFDPAKKKWANGPALPEGRAYGHAVQTGNSLVYTLGYSAGQTDLSVEEQSCPKNLIFNGTAWTASNEDLTPLVINDTINRGSTEYVCYDGNIGICKGGIVYIGTEAEDYGDTFTYNVKNDKFEDTGYNYYLEIGDNGASGIAVGKKAFIFDEDAVNTIPIDTGMVRISCGKVKNGKVTGVNRYYNPGDKAKIVAKAKKKCVVKSLKVGAKKVKVKKNAKKVTYTTPVLTKDLKVKAKFKKK